MREIGIDMSQSHPKHLSRATLESLDLVIHMGCGAPGMCLVVPGVPSEDWGVEDPVGKPIEKYREVSDIIEMKVRELAARLRSDGPPSASRSSVTFELSSSSI